MTIYLKDGYTVVINEPEDDSTTLEIDFGHPDGYVHVKQWMNLRSHFYTRFTAPKENVIFIDMENEGGSEWLNNYRPPLEIYLNGKRKE